MRVIEILLFDCYFLGYLINIIYWPLVVRVFLFYDCFFRFFKKFIRIHRNELLLGDYLIITLLFKSYELLNLLTFVKISTLVYF